MYRIPFEDRARESQILLSWRQENKYTLQKLSKETGISASTLYLFESRRSTKPIQAMIAARLKDLGINFDGFQISTGDKGKRITIKDERMNIQLPKIRKPRKLINESFINMAELAINKAKDYIKQGKEEIEQLDISIKKIYDEAEIILNKAKELESKRDTIKMLIEKALE